MGPVFSRSRRIEARSMSSLVSLLRFDRVNVLKSMSTFPVGRGLRLGFFSVSGLVVVRLKNSSAMSPSASWLRWPTLRRMGASARSGLLRVSSASRIDAATSAERLPASRTSPNKLGVSLRKRLSEPGGRGLEGFDVGDGGCFGCGGR